MIISDKKLDNSRMELVIEVPEDKIGTEYLKVFEGFRKNAKIDGFRKGKVPLDIIKKRFKNNADVEVTENIVKNAYMDALKEKELFPISEPEIDIEKQIEAEKPFKFSIKFDIPPTVVLGGYKNISVKENECKVSDADIDKEIQSLRERYATITKREKDERAEKGDYVRAEVTRIDNFEKPGDVKDNQKSLSLILGKAPSDTSFDDDIVGMIVDEQKEVTKKYPKDFQQSDIAGQKVKYLLRIVEISKLTLPALDDEFAKDVGQYNSLDDLKTKIKEEFERMASDRIKKIVQDELLKKIIEDSKFDLPESMIAKEIANMTSKVESGIGLKSGGIEELFANGSINKDEFTKKIREDAINNIKSTLVLIEVAKAEKIEAPEDKYKEIISSYAERSKKTFEEIEEIVEQNGSKENIKNELVLGNSYDFLYANANIKKQKPITLEELMKI
ncbi:MAG: trigger factor [Spirochaetota bacterium]